MDVSVILVNYFTSSLMADALASLQEKTERLEYEIIVVDNSNDEKEFNALKEVAKPYGATLLNPQENLGFGRANNLGAQLAKGRYLFFLNGDTLFINNAMKELVDFLDNHPEAGIAGSNLFDRNQNPYASFLKKELSLRSFKKMNSAWSLIWRNALHKRADFNYTDEPMEVFGGVIGAAMMMDKDLFHELDGFDERIFMFAEETLLCFRARHEKGKGSFNVPSSKIIHLEGQSFSASSAARKASFWVQGNYIYYLTAFGQEAADKFLAISAKTYAKKARICKLLRKKEKQQYYAAFKEQIESFAQQKKAEALNV